MHSKLTRMLSVLVVAILMALVVAGCNGGGTTTPPLPPPPDIQDQPEPIHLGRIDLSPEVEVRFVDSNLRNERLTDNPLSEDPIFELMNQAQQSLDIAVMRINRQELVDALLQQAQVTKVRIVTEKSFYDDPVYKPFYAQLENPLLNNNNIEIHTDLEGEPRMMHSRFMIIDGSRTVTGSYDWSAAGARDTIGDVLIIKDSRITSAFKNQFEQMYASRLFGNAKRDMTQHIWQVGGGAGRVEVYFGPTDDLRTRIETQVALSANIGFSVKEFSDITLANYILGWSTLNGRNFTGIINDVGFSTSADEQNIYTAFVDRILAGNTGDAAANPLSDSSINNGNPYITTVSNHKYIVCDREFLTTSNLGGTLNLAPDDAPCVITGSANWTPSSFDFNDECMVVLLGDPLAAKYVGWVNPLSPSFSELQTDVRPEDFGEMVPDILQFPNVPSPTSTLIPTFQVPYAIIYGVISNFKPTITIGTPPTGGGAPPTLDITVVFDVSGKTYLSTGTADDVQNYQISNFDRSDATNPLHGYIIVVPAGNLTVSPLLAEPGNNGTSGSTIAGANNPSYDLEVGPGGVRRLDMSIGSPPSEFNPNGSGGGNGGGGSGGGGGGAG